MKYSTPDLCDDNPDSINVLDAMFTSYGARDSFFGEIVTIKCFEDNSLVKDNLGKPGAGKVLVVDGGGSLRRALLGDLIATNAFDNKWEGIIIYGCVRDVEVLANIDIGIQAIGSVPLKTEKRGVGELNIPLRFGGVSIVPGDYIYADINGVIVSPDNLIPQEKEIIA
jgi:regulator of ribonuclease activity A